MTKWETMVSQCVSKMYIFCYKYNIALRSIFLQILQISYILSSFLPQPLPGKTGGDQVRAYSSFAELLATGLDLDGLCNSLESMAARHTVVHDIDVRIFKLDDFSAVDAHKMIVRWLVEEVWIVGRLVVTQVDLAQQGCLHQQAEGAVNSGSGSFGIHFPDPVIQFIRSEMFILGEGGLYDHVTLARPAQSLAPDKIVKFLLNAFLHEGKLTTQNAPVGRGKVRIDSGENRVILSTR